MAEIVTLINDPAWKAAVQQAIAVRALAGAVSVPDQTASRARLNRVLLGNPAQQATLAGEWLTPVALTPSIRARYESSSDWIVGDVEYVVEQQLVARAAAPVTNYIAITNAATNEDTLRTLAAALHIAANDVLADPSASAAKLAFVREHMATPQAARTTANEFVGLIITTPQLRPYGGDLTGVTDQEISDAIGAFLTNWLRAAA